MSSDDACEGRVRVRFAVLAGLLFLLAIPGSALARSNAIITLSVGDALNLSGSRIQCGVSANRGYGLRLAGLTYIVCGPSSEVKGGGYVALMDSKGRVVVLSIRTEKTVSSRTPASAVSRSGGNTARIGDVVAINGTPILCLMIKVGGVPTLLCEYVDGKGVVRPNSYSFGISDTVASSLHWDATKEAFSNYRLWLGTMV
jgi:hypothetical protein